MFIGNIQFELFALFGFNTIQFVLFDIEFTTNPSTSYLNNDTTEKKTGRFKDREKTTLRLFQCFQRSH